MRMILVRLVTNVENGLLCPACPGVFATSTHISSQILATGANAIFTTKGMDDMSIKYLVEGGAIGVRRVDKADMKRLARVTGGKIQLTLANLDGEESFDGESLGSCEVVEETRVGDNDFIFVRGAKESKASTLLLRGANEYMLEETERSVHDALMAVSKTAESSSVVPGIIMEKSSVPILILQNVSNMSNMIHQHKHNRPVSSR